MTDFPDIKLKAIPTFPSRIIGGTGIEATGNQGSVTIDMAWNEFATQEAVPTSLTNNVLTFDTATEQYVMVPSQLLGGAVAGISEAPVDGIQYGRQSGTWTPAVGVVDYETRASVEATFIPPSVDFVRISGYYAAGDRGGALYKRGAGPIAAGKILSADGSFWEIAEAQVTARMFGAKGDGVTNDYTAIAGLRDYCRPRSIAMAFDDGNYAFGTTLEFAFFRSMVIALSPYVRFKFTGTGVAVSFNGYLYNPTAGAHDCVFGGAYPIHITGNANCTTCFYYNNCHHSHFNVAGRDCTHSVLRAMSDDGTGTFVGQASGVETTVELTVSAVADQLAFSVIPVYGAFIEYSAACMFIKFVTENCANGISLINSNGNTFIGGTAESNSNFGVYLGGTSSRNQFHSFHNEVNLSNWYIGGAANHNAFYDCAGAGTGNNRIFGDYNRFVGGDWWTTIVETGANNNTFDSCDFTAPFTNNGTGTIITNPSAVATPSFLPVSHGGNGNDSSWTAVSFSAANFTANGSGTWTVAVGDVITNMYNVRGKVMTYIFTIQLSTVGGTPSTELRIAIPGGYLNASRTCQALGLILDNGTRTTAYADTGSAGASYIAIVKHTGAAWVVSTDNTYVYGQITFPIQ